MNTIDIKSEVHPHWQAVLLWGKEHPNCQITLCLQDGIPTRILTPTYDNIGLESIFIDKIARKYGLK